MQSLLYFIMTTINCLYGVQQLIGNIRRKPTLLQVNFCSQYWTVSQPAQCYLKFNWSSIVGFF